MDGRTKIVVSRLGTLSPTTGPLKSYIFSIIYTNSLSKWSNYPNSIREKYQTPWTIRFYLVTSGPNFLGYSMKIEYFLTCVFFWKNLAMFNSSQSKRLTIARCKKNDYVQSSWSIWENLAMCGEKQSPKYLRKNKTLWKKNPPKNQLDRLKRSVAV